MQECLMIGIFLCMTNIFKYKLTQHMCRNQTKTFIIKIWSHLKESFVCSRYRYLAYRMFVSWCWGFLGRRIRVVNPSCVVLRVRREFPDSQQEYMGFRLPPLGWSKRCSWQSPPPSQAQVFNASCAMKDMLYFYFIFMFIVQYYAKCMYSKGTLM